MRLNCKTRVLSLLRQIRALQVNSKCPEAVLILDDITTPLLSSAISEFMVLGVKDITKVTLKKKPCPTYAGIYYISKQSLSFLGEDFKKEAIYHSINLLLNQHIDQDIMKTVAQNKQITDRLAYFGQLHLNVKYITNNLALICREDRLFSSFLKNQHQKPASDISEILLEAIIGGFQDPQKLIVYHSYSNYIQDIVKDLAGKYKEYRKSIEESPEKKEGRTLRIVVFDRKMDPISPLVSNFYYLNMISDIFRVDFEHRQVLLRNNSKINLDFDDPIFQDYKNLHIAKVQAKIEPDLLKFKTQNKAAKMQSEGSSPQKNRVSNIDMKHIISLIPQYNKKIKIYENHVNMSLQITQISKEEKLPEIGEIEQMIVSGIDGRGEEVKDKRIIERAQELCLRIKDPEKIVKIMLLMLFCLECSESQRKLFINKIKEYHQYSSLAQMALKQMPKLIPKPMKLRPNPQKQKVFLHMHESLIESILVELIQKGKSPNVSLSVIGNQQKKKLQSKFEAIGKKEEREWLIVMLGGISMNEIVQLQRVQERYKGNKVNFISSEVLTTWSYMDRLGSLFEE